MLNWLGNSLVLNCFLVTVNVGDEMIDHIFAIYQILMTFTALVFIGIITLVNIKDLAKHLNSSIGTVSRALNNRPNVNKDTRKKVLQAAADLGYVANQSGRSLRQGTTNAIGFLINTSDANEANSDNFFRGLLMVCNRHWKINT